MEPSSRTGLLAAVRIPLYHRHVRARDRIRMATGWYLTTGPAPVIQRPFAGIFNPFPYRCSVLCNHPADLEARSGFRRARNSQWAAEDGDQETGVQFTGAKHARHSFMNAPAMTDDWVPEELFRKYTETDSRPPSPAPTLASLETIKNSSNKRSVTARLSSGKENKTQIVLDLRRSHSQETLSWREMVTPVPLLPPPSHEKASTTASRRFFSPPSQRQRPSPQQARRPRPPPPAPKHLAEKQPEGGAAAAAHLPVAPEVVVMTEEDLNLGGEATPRRRGVRRRGRKKSRGQSPSKDFQHLEEPAETQISMADGEEQQGIASSDSAQGALVVAEDVLGAGGGDELRPRGHEEKTFSSFLSDDVIRQLQRQLDWHKVEAEFDFKRKVALTEAMRAPKLISPEGTENTFQQNDLWLSVPRSFSRKSARFELPMDSRKLNRMTPLQYAQQLIQISRSRKLLYNEIFNKHREDSGMENEARSIKMKVLPTILTEVMGREISSEDLKLLSELLGLPDDKWKQPSTLDFRTFCGVCAIAERVFGARWGLLETEHKDPKHLVESADFSRLQDQLNGMTDPESQMPRLLLVISN
ncbi:uncharacterized protein LOC135947414 [Cloeon dipterum]|uniref:uncharacterized protein LOC135947414 n=1 Tax=Cloeon dipterum TaxID=197152 RepID=UPI00321FEAF8